MKAHHQLETGLHLLGFLNCNLTTIECNPSRRGLERPQMLDLAMPTAQVLGSRVSPPPNPDSQKVDVLVKFILNL